MNQTVEKIKRLERFVAHKGAEDKVLDKTINKILHREIIKLQTQIDKFNYDLKRFEDKYEISSIQFRQQFESGKLGDNIDFMEWISTIEMMDKAEEYVLNLKGE